MQLTRNSRNSSGDVDVNNDCAEDDDDGDD